MDYCRNTCWILCEPAASHSAWQTIQRDVRRRSPFASRVLLFPASFPAQQLTPVTSPQCRWRGNKVCSSSFYITLTAFVPFITKRTEITVFSSEGQNVSKYFRIEYLVKGSCATALLWDSHAERFRVTQRDKRSPFADRAGRRLTISAQFKLDLQAFSFCPIISQKYFFWFGVSGLIKICSLTANLINNWRRNNSLISQVLRSAPALDIFYALRTPRTISDCKNVMLCFSIAFKYKNALNLSFKVSKH